MEVGKIQYNEFNYKRVNKDKHRVILINSYTNSIDKFLDGYVGVTGVYSYLPHFYIDKNGLVVKMLDVDKDTNITNTEIDNASIVVVLENLGYLLYKDNMYLDIYNNKYLKNEVEVDKKKWRNYTIWEQYSDEQYNVLGKLLLTISKENKIPLDVTDNNLKKDNLLNFRGIVYRSNIDEIYRDVSPSFNIDKLLSYLKKPK